MSAYLDQALLLLDQTEVKSKEVSEAKEILESVSMDKKAGILDTISDPKLANIVTLLTPFVMNYKVNQVLKLLEEIAKEQKKYDPQTGRRKYF